VILVRHGDAAAGWSDDLDPGLSPIGQAQAAAVTGVLAPLGPLPIVCSPMRRCRETAAPLASEWAVEPTVDARVGEIQSPDHNLTSRGAWLGKILHDEWAHLSPELQHWRNDVVGCLLQMQTDTVVVSHFVAINAAIGAATGDDRVMSRRVGNCSTTTFETDGRDLVLVAEPVEAADTKVL
jgi:broad specificity phosphatase PhoE